MTADICLGLLAGDIKRKEMLSDAWQIFMPTCLSARRFLNIMNMAKTAAEQVHAKLALEKSLFNAQEAFYGLFDNFPVGFAAGLSQVYLFPAWSPCGK